MKMPSAQAIEEGLVEPLRRLFPHLTTELSLGDEPELDYMEIFLDDINSLMLSIDSDGVEVALDFAYFSFLFAKEDPLAYKVIAAGYEEKSLAQLFADVLAFIHKTLLNRELELRHSTNGSRLCAFELWDVAGEESLYRYTFAGELCADAKMKVKRITIKA